MTIISDFRKSFYFNYKNIFKYIHSRGFDGIMGMEHGNSRPDKAGEMAVIEAYKKVDNFL